MSDTLRVAEVFTSLQGEGPAAGQHAVFLRLAGCNLSCTWCDTAYTWDSARYCLWDEVQHLTVDQILGALDPAVRLMILTGGEPLLQQTQPAMEQLLAGLPRRLVLHVETNGTLEPSAALLDRVALWSVSPKMDNAGAHRGHQDPRPHSYWADHRPVRAHLKMVCTDDADAYHAVLYADSLGWPRHRVWLMPEGDNSAVIAARWPAIAEAAVKWGVNASHRLQVLAGWGRGQ